MTTRSSCHTYFIQIVDGAKENSNSVQNPVMSCLYKDRRQRQQTISEGVGERKSWKGSILPLDQAGNFFSPPEQSLSLSFEKS